MAQEEHKSTNLLISNHYLIACLEKEWQRLLKLNLGDNVDCFNLRAYTFHLI